MRRPPHATLGQVLVAVSLANDIEGLFHLPVAVWKGGDEKDERNTHTIQGFRSSRDGRREVVPWLQFARTEMRQSAYLGSFHVES